MRTYHIIPGLIASLALAGCYVDPERDADDGTVVSLKDLGNGCNVWKIRERDTYDGFVFVTHCQRDTTTAYDETHRSGKITNGVAVQNRTENGQ